ncbi:MAG: sugar ABC transporter permease [Clostridia bacterium]|nr:sugar ABC transporter permease [Clostridia bacterium]MBR0215186.1 sugar ABC transporter permease [Solobacterium sp.]
MQRTTIPETKRHNPLVAFLTNRKVVPYVFVAPFVLYFLLIYLYPTIATIMMSFQRIDGPTSVVWIGAKNYERLFSRNYIQALETTARYAFWDVVVLTSVPLLFAVLLHSQLVKFSSFFKSLFFIPSLTSIIVAGIVFRLAFGTLETAPVNTLVRALGGQPRDWLMFPDTGNMVLIILTLWRWMGVNIIYYLSGIQSIPPDLYEAAEIDGANPIQRFFHVTLPGIKPVLIYVITITVLGGFAMFTESVALWQQNNPGGVGRTIVGYMYMMGFYKSNMGMASAIGLSLLVLVLAVNMIQLVLMGFFKKED